MVVARELLCLVVGVFLLPYLARFAQHIRQVVRRLYLTRHVPGPRSLPVIGCLTDFFRLMTNPQVELADLMARFGSTIRFTVFDRTVIFVMDPDDVQAVCMSPAFANKPDEYLRFMGAHIGGGLLNINGQKHRRHRKAITPSLHSDILNEFVSVFAQHAEAMAKRVEAHAERGDVFNVQPEFGRLASGTILETVLTARLAVNDLTDKDYIQRVDAINETNSVMTYRALRPWWQNETVFRLFSDRYEPFMRTAKVMDSMVTRVLKAKTTELSLGLPPPPQRRMAFLDHFLRSKEKTVMTEDELRDELKTFLFVGSSTSMDFLSLVALTIAMEKDVQKRVHQEVDEVFGAPGSPGWDRELTPDDLGHLQYTERVLREVLRYAPPVPFMFRVTTEDATLPGGTFVPLGTYICLIPGGTHRLAEHFKDPLKFDPDRFLPDNSRGRHPYAFIPFSAGARNCLGMRYAMMLAKTVVATLLRRYDLDTAPDGPQSLADVRVDAGVTLMVRGGTNIRLHRRTPATPTTS